MCGIAGVVHVDPGSTVDAAPLERMADAMAHRGPDGHGTWVSGGVGLAHRRLAIIDLAGGRQPMVSDDTGAVVTFNGEIYNFQALRQELSGRGARFRDRSDTEVVLRAYEHWGEDAVEHLDGMFAFAIWDPRAGRLFAARDRLGIKPLFYRWSERTLMFASELKAFAARGDVPLEVNPAAFESYLRLQYVKGPASIFKGIRQLPAGSTLTIDLNGGPRERRYWDAAGAAASRLQRHQADNGNDVERCRSLLTDAVASHLVSDVPVGAFLSGGLDSSLIVALMAKGTRVSTFSIGFEGGAAFDERPHAARVARHLGTDHEDQLVTGHDAVEGIPSVVARMDEPFADYAALPTLLLSQVAARRVKVVLTGEGADEIFGGYRRYRKERWLAPLGRMRSVYQSTHLFNEDEVRELTGHSATPPDTPAPVHRGLDPLNRVLAQDVNGWLVDDLLTKVDRMTMLCSLEARVPYLDHRLVEFALGVPGHRKVGLFRDDRKKILREVAAPFLPPEAVERPKHGFTPPLMLWFKGALGELARDTLLDPSARILGRVNGATVRRLLTSDGISPSQGHRIWALLVYELWSRRYGVA